MFEINYELEGVDTKTFYGVQNQNFNLIKSSFPTLKITGRDNFIFAMGNRETLDVLKQKLDDVTAYMSKHNSLEIKNLEEIEKRLITEVKDIEVKMVNLQNEKEKILEKITKIDKDLEYYTIELEEINNKNIKESVEYKKIENEIEVNAIKRKLSMDEKSRLDIGAVNLASIEEYEKENERYNNLVDQKRDLIDSR